MPRQSSRHDEDRRQELLPAALEYAEAGIPIIPLHSINPRGLCTCGKKKCSNAGKHPRTRRGFKDATTDKSKIRRWWKQWPDANIGGALGEVFVAIDIDPKNGGRESLEQLEGELGGLPFTATAKTGKHGNERGEHFYFLTPGGIGCTTNLLGRDGIDLRGVGGYVVMPPSRHKSGVDYEWERPLSKAVPIPEEIAEAVAMGGEALVERDEDWKPSGRPLSKKTKRLLKDGDWSVGEQRDTALKCTRLLLDSGAERDEVVEAIFSALENSDQSDEAPWTERDVERLVDDLIKKPPPPKRQRSQTEIEQTLTDTGNAERFAQRFSDEVRWVPEWKSWVFWAGDRWRKDADVYVTQRMQEVARAIASEASQVEDDAVRGKILSWARTSLHASKVKAAVEMARAQQTLIARPDEFDSHRHLLNCRNGTLDLKAGELQPHRREDMLTQQVRCDFDPKATSKDWEKVLRDAFDGSEEMVAYLRRVFGYSLTGDASEEKFFFFYGKSGAGKGTILEAFGGMLGDYERTVDSKTLTKGALQSGGAASEDIARLHGGRFAIANEFDPGAKFAAAQVNTLTGRDKIAARYMYQGTFEFYPQFKLFIAANDRPMQSANPESGIWRRIQVVPFEHKVEKVDKDLKSRLQTDEARSAILTWAFKGCLEWQRDGLGEVPEQIAEAVDDYKEASDPHLAFIETRLEKSEGDFVPNTVMWEEYQVWAKDEGVRRPVTQKALTPILKERGFEQGKKRSPKGGSPRKVWLDVRIRGVSDQVQRSYQAVR